MPNVLGDTEQWANASQVAVGFAGDFSAELASARLDGDRDRLARAVERLLVALDRAELLRAEIAARVRATEAALERMRLYRDDLGRSSPIDPPAFR